MFCQCLFLTSPVDVRRLEFDAYRSDLEELSLGPRDAAAMVRIEMAQQEYQHHRDKYERLRSDVSIKLKFLEENKVCFTNVLLFSFISMQLWKFNGKPWVCFGIKVTIILCIFKNVWEINSFSAIQTVC